MTLGGRQGITGLLGVVGFLGFGMHACASLAVADLAGRVRVPFKCCLPLYMQELVLLHGTVCWLPFLLVVILSVLGDWTAPSDTALYH
jgi:hypothetical protein